MRIKTNKSRFLGTAFLLLLTAACIFCAAGCSMDRDGGNDRKESQRLTQAQIAQLRQEYPMIKDSPLVDGRIPTMSEMKGRVDTFVYGTVEGEAPADSKSVSTGDAGVDAKRSQNGIDDVFPSYAYTLSVIEDTEGVFKAGDKVVMVTGQAYGEDGFYLEG